MSAAMDDQHDASIDRRDFLRLGGLTVAFGAVIAACGSATESGQPGRVGLAPTTTRLPDATVDDAALLRTASSLQHSLMRVYTKVATDAALLDPKYGDLAKRFFADHQAQAKTLEALTIAAGAAAWSCSNPKTDSVLIDPALQRITVGVAATADAKAIGPSDDQRRDILNLLHGLEGLSAASAQTMTSMIVAPEHRLAMIKVAAREARHAALLASNINPARPGGLIAASDVTNAQVAASTPETTTNGPTTSGQNIAAPSSTTGATTPSGAQLTPIPDAVAVPGQFGELSTILLVVGAGDENGTRLKVNLETPSLNSYIYSSLEPGC